MGYGGGVGLTEGCGVMDEVWGYQPCISYLSWGPTLCLFVALNSNVCLFWGQPTICERFFRVSLSSICFWPSNNCWHSKCKSPIKVTLKYFLRIVLIVL